MSNVSFFLNIELKNKLSINFFYENLQSIEMHADEIQK